MPKFIQYQSLEHQKSGDITIHKITFNHKMSPQMTDFSLSEKFFFTLFHSPIYIQTSNEKKRYLPGALICWPMGSRIRFGHLKKNWENSYIILSGPRAQELFSNFPNLEVLNLKNREIVLQSFKNIYHELTNFHLPNTKILSNTIENMLIQILRSTQNKMNHTIIPEPFLEAKKYLSNHYQKTINIEDLSSKMNLSHTYFSKKFKKYFYCTPLEYTIRLRLNHARELLQQTNMKIGKIAEKVGFENCFYFSNTIKKHFKCSPKELRIQLKSGKKAKIS